MSSIILASLLVIGAPLALWTLTLLALGAAAILPGRRSGRRAARLAVVIPAHDEAAGIAATVAEVRAALPAGGRVLVVADNCEDETAARARAAGAEVLEREDATRRGKGYALAAAREALEADPDWEWMVVVDADARLAPGFFEALIGGAGEARIVQGCYLPAPEARGARAGLLKVAWGVFNALRPMGRTRLGGSADVLGNGFAFRREVAAPLASGCVVEDLEWGLRALAEGERVAFAPAARLFAPPAPSAQAAAPQRRRWEAGRLAVARAWLPRLLRGEAGWVGLEAALSLSIPPLTLLGAAILGWTGMAALAGLWSLAALGAAALASLLLLCIAGLWVSGQPLRELLSLVAAPAYLLWKLRLYAGAEFWGAARAWVRTPREVEL